MKLFYSPGACSLAPHVLVRELGIEAEIDLVRVSIAQGDNLQPEYLSINPTGRVPALQIGTGIYTEVPAILVYLASRGGRIELLPPAGSPELARCLECLAWLSSSLHIAYAQLWRPQRFLAPGSNEASFTAQGKIHIERMNGELEARITGDWLLPGGYSIADIHALPFYRWGNRIGLPMRELCPRWHASVRRIVARPAVRAAIDQEGIGFELFDPGD